MTSSLVIFPLILTVAAYPYDEFLTTGSNWYETVCPEKYPYLAKVITNCSLVNSRELSEDTGVIIAPNYVLGINSKPQGGCTYIVRVGMDILRKKGTDRIAEPVVLDNTANNGSANYQLEPFHQIVLYKFNETIAYGSRSKAIKVLKAGDVVRTGDNVLSNGMDLDISKRVVGVFESNVTVIREKRCRELYQQWIGDHISKNDYPNRHMGIFCSVHYYDQDYPGFSSTIVFGGELVGLRAHSLTMAVGGRNYALNIYLNVTEHKYWIEKIANIVE